MKKALPTNLAAKKSLGQHFLVNADICARIVALLDIRKDDFILEVGPGQGALSRLLLQTDFSRLIFIEKDSRWAGQLAERQQANVEILNDDALDFDWKSLEGQWKLIGNLPYNVASPLLWDMVSRVPDWLRAVFMVQLEVARRIAASPGGRDYGALSVWIQSYALPRLEFKVSPGSFRPPPKVDSGVLLLLPKPASALPKNPDKLKELLKICFQNRRKQLGSIFRNSKLAQMGKAMEKLGLNPGLRPENLDPETFNRLAAFL